MTPMRRATSFLLWPLPVPSPRPLPGVCGAEQFVSFAGRVLCDETLLCNAGVCDESELYVSLRLLGGAKKRKKKTYSKPKKIKHVHKKVKLRTLNYYKVDGSGKVERLRKVCPTCGPGIFMATHHDRVYCGLCHQTYVYAKDGKN